ncbi:hypothetical protein ACFQ36_17325 [Arthrobacter sp. GCM10027362]|uniref:hypothetical protein n=1 Tax=Arthrobacter sp. GCM10027362 TaxID=3273379 RepID=UPI00363A9997
MSSQQHPIRRRAALGLVLVSVPPALWWAVRGQGPASAPCVPPGRARAASMACWGSSTVAEMSEYMRNTAAGYGLRYFNGGAGGQTAEQILARLGSRPARMDSAVIPSSGSVVLSTPSMSARGAAPFGADGSLAGIPGTLSKAPGAQPGYSFRRHHAGKPRRIAEGTEFLPSKGAEFRAGINHLNIGKNNLTGAPWATHDPDAILEWTHAAHDWLAAAGRQILVWGYFVNTGIPASSPVRDRISHVNRALQERYGRCFVDLAGLVTDLGAWARTGLHPTWADLQQQALGNMPPSLSRNSAHLNARGYQALREVIDGRLRELNWAPSPGKLVT